MLDAAQIRNHFTIVHKNVAAWGETNSSVRDPLNSLVPTPKGSTIQMSTAPAKVAIQLWPKMNSGVNTEIEIVDAHFWWHE